MKLINIGFGSLIAAERLISVLSPDSAPIKRMIQDTRERGLLVDASYGRKTKSVLVTDGGYLFLSALTPEAVAARAGSPIGQGLLRDVRLPRGEKRHAVIGKGRLQLGAVALKGAHRDGDIPPAAARPRQLDGARGRELALGGDGLGSV